MPAEDTKSVLGLTLPTDPRWANLAEMSLEAILIDHAYCEQKAATTCISLIVQYPEKQALVNQLSPVVTEEWGHFRAVLNEMEKRNIKLGRQRKDEYVNQLLKHIRKGGSGEAQFLDRLLTAALVEARSCERFKLLHHNIEDSGLQRFYYDLMVSEAGHYRLFIDLAKTYIDKASVNERWQDLLAIEGDIMKNLTVRGDRMH